MLVNENSVNSVKHVEFINYDGKWPHLCSGMLTLKIDGKTVKFGNQMLYPESKYPKFWMSGGECTMEDITEDEWIIDVDELPEEYRKYADEINHVFNENVEYGCCGGCR